LEGLEAVTSAEELLTLQEGSSHIRVEESVREYIVQVARATRGHPSVELGVSPRGTLFLYKTCQALAAIRGRDFVIPDDVKHLAPYVLTHRIIINPQTRLRGRTPEEVVMEVVNSVPVPVEK
jgi:MoxR-like ATPase